MKTKCFALLAIVTGWLLLVAVQLSVAQSVPPVKIILDTDMAADCDDLGAVAVLHALANQGKANILGMVCNVSDTNSPLCLSAVNTYYGRPDIPIGYLNDTSVSPFLTPLYVYLNEYTDYIADTNRYPRYFVTNAVPDALDVYMQLLRTNSGVTIISIGSFYNLDKLLSANRELVRTKVAKLVVMGGKYPPDKQVCPNFDFNFSLARDAAMRVVSNWPTPIVFTELGDHVITGTNLFDDAKVASDNPIRKGYELGTKDGHPDNNMTPNAKERPSWDPITVLYAVEGATTNFVEVGNGGTNVIEECLFSFANNRWYDGAGNNHSYLAQLVPDDVLAARIEELMTEQPIPRAPSSLSAIAISTNEIDLTWQRNADNEDGYDIERSTDGINFDLIGFTMGAITTSFADDTGLNPCTTYYYRVRAYNSSGNSDFSNIANATTVCGPNDGLVAYYPFHGNANDESGNGHNGVNLGADN
jgi:inosine-uridine nucleoside N-ribohydrolase